MKTITSQSSEVVLATRKTSAGAACHFARKIASTLGVACLLCCAGQAQSTDPLEITADGQVNINGTVPRLNLISGADNVFAGMGAGSVTLTTGNKNTAFGRNALGNITENASFNVALGSNSLSKITTGSHNTAIGTSALINLSNGRRNIAVGSNAGVNLETGCDHNICIGHAGVDGDSGVIRIGTPGTHKETHLAGKVHTNALHCLPNGNIGIGTETPTRAKLVVDGVVTNPEYNFHGVAWGANARSGKLFLSGSGTVNGHAARVPRKSISIFASGAIAGEEFLAFSDARIKCIEGRSDMARDLATLMDIEVTDYTHIDTISKGAGKNKKAVGQQVEKIYPQAVGHTTDVVPDIFAKAAIQNGWVQLATDLKPGDRVKLIADEGAGIHEVLEVTPDKFRTDFTPEGDKVFVYGREVNDFRTVDYDAIAMLNVSATQQIKKEKDVQIKALQDENDILRARLDRLEKMVTRLASSAAESPSNQTAAFVAASQAK